MTDHALRTGAPDRPGSALTAALEAGRGASIEHLFSAVLDRTHMMAVLLDPEFNFLWVNRAYAESCRHEPSFFPGRNHFDLYPDEENQAIFRRVVETGEPFFVAAKPFEFPDQPGRGVTYWDWSLIPILDETDGVAALVFTLADVTERVGTQEALRVSIERHQSIIETAIDGFWVTDLEGRLLEANAAYCRMSGYSADELLGMRIGDLEAIERPEETSARIRQIVDAGSARFETKHRRRDGSTFDVEVSVQYRPVDGGRLVQFLRDVTDRKLAERALTHSHDLMREVIEHSRSGVAVFDREMRYVYVSKRFLQEYHVPRSDVIGVCHYDLFPDLPQSIRDVHSRVLAGAVEGAEEDPFRREDGTVDWTRWECRPWHEADGTIGGIVLYTEVISERKRVEDELRLFKAIFDAANFGAAITDLDGIVTYANRRFAVDHGLGEGEVLGQSIIEIHEPGQQEHVRELLRELTTEGHLDAREVRHRRRDRTVSPVLVTGVLLKDASGAPAKMAVTAVDLTERKVLEAQLHQAQQVEAVGRLAGGVAHDFNNMLGVILGHAEIALSDLAPSHPVRADLLEIREAAERSADLTRQLLAFARRQAIAPQVLDPNEAVAATLRMLERLIGEDIRLIWRPGSELGRILIDPSQLNRVLANLCVNARDAIGGVGTITIETANITADAVFCAAHSDAEPGEYVVLSVSDTGIGMDEETLAHIFEPFFTTKADGRGTGLGLSTVYGAVRQNNGFIDVASTPGQGTTFRVHLPRVEAPAARVTPAPQPQPGPSGRATVLLVEDEPSILRLGASMLRRLGCTVIAAGGPGDALRLAAENPAAIDVLMTDVVMPEMNGRELARRLASTHPELRTIFMSGYTADVIADHGVLGEDIHFLEKPFTLRDVAVRLGELGLLNTAEDVEDAGVENDASGRVQPESVERA